MTNTASLWLPAQLLWNLTEANTRREWCNHSGVTEEELGGTWHMIWPLKEPGAEGDGVQSGPARGRLGQRLSSGRPRGARAAGGLGGHGSRGLSSGQRITVLAGIMGAFPEGSLCGKEQSSEKVMHFWTQGDFKRRGRPSSTGERLGPRLAKPQSW